ncbi:ribonuclease D [Klebsiella pneumoniae subsp. ozaenae]|uniref:Ribonuclease D n=1 Tax=Klebsiella pneumoniae subsp. ozaenae TaxID=574 RepID=A0A378BHD2_KLEPO|nr:ribonuclease D [Klebsiella pneumoniae subsp. ozaenae]
MPGYRKVFKDIKALVQEVSTEKGVSAELLASCRQINQLLNWHWQLKTQAGEPELISGLARGADGRAAEEAVKRLSALVRGQVQTIKKPAARGVAGFFSR